MQKTAYEMRISDWSSDVCSSDLNGLPITEPASGYDADNPYANRDPRLDYTVVHNESRLLLYETQQKELVYTYAGASPDGLGGPGSPTGYYVNKMLDAEVTNHIFTTSLRCLPLIRYAEEIGSASCRERVCQ